MKLFRFRWSERIDSEAGSLYTAAFFDNQEEWIMSMSERSLRRLRCFRESVQRVISVVRSGKPFLFRDNGLGITRPIPEWGDLKLLTKKLGRCVRNSDISHAPCEYAITMSIKRALDGFNGRGKLSNAAGMHQYLRYIRDDKASGGYQSETELLFFLGRLRNYLTNRIAWEKRAARLKQRK